MERNDPDSDLRSPAAKRSKNLDLAKPVWRDNVLKVSNLPEKFMENTFISFIEKYRIKKGIFSNEQRTVVKCEKFLKLGFVSVEFIHSEIVEALGSRTDAYFQKRYLVLEAPIHLNDTFLGTEDDVSESDQAGLNDTLIASSTPSTSTPNSSTAEVVNLMKNLTPFKKNLNAIFVNEGPGKPIEDTLLPGIDEIPVNEGPGKPIEDTLLPGIDEIPVNEGPGKPIEDALLPGIDAISVEGPEKHNVNKDTSLPGADGSVLFMNHTQNKKDKALKDCQVPTSQVGIHNLPADFDQRDIIYEINKALWKYTLLEKPFKPIIASDIVGDTTLILTFDSPEHAKLAVDLPLIEYADSFLTLEQIFQEAPKKSSNKVRIFELPVGFEARDVIYEVHKALWRQNAIKKPHKPVLASDRLDDSALILTFDCPEHASLALGLPEGVEYEDTHLKMEQFFEVSMKPKPTNKVKILNVPEGFEARDVVYEIHKAMWKYTLLEKQSKPIIAWDIVSDTNLILTFDSTEHATMAVELSQVEYDDILLKMEHVYDNSSTMSTSTTMTETKASCGLDEAEIEICHEVDDSQDESSLATVLFDEKGYPVIPVGIVPRTDWPTFETLTLIEAMIKFRAELTHRNTHTQKQGYISLGTFMYQRKLYYTARNLKAKIKTLVCTYQSDLLDPLWEYKRLIAMYVGEESFDASVLNEMFSNYKPTAAPKRRSLVEENKLVCGVVVLANCKAEELSHLFDDKSTFLLISSYRAYKPLFDDDLHRSDELYSDISSKLKGFGCNVSGEDCSKRMAYIAKKYKEIEDMRLMCTGTGSDMTNWIYYDAMSQLFEKSRIMNPQKLLAAGSASLTKTRKEEDDDYDEDDDLNNNTTSSGRGRKKKRTKNSYSSSVSTVSFKERKLQLGSQLIEELRNLSKGLVESRK